MVIFFMQEVILLCFWRLKFQSTQLNNHCYYIIFYLFPVTINSSTSHATKLMDVPQYFAHTHGTNILQCLLLIISRFIETSVLFCSFHLALTSSASPSCISALFYNKQESVHYVISAFWPMKSDQISLSYPPFTLLCTPWLLLTVL